MGADERTPPRSWAERLGRARRGRLARALGEAAAGWLGACLPGLGGFFLAALLLPPGRAVSGALAAAAMAWILATFAWRILRPLLEWPTLPRYALWLERRAALGRNEFTNALALERDARWETSPVSRDLVALALERAARTLEGLPLSRLHAERRLLPPLRLALLGLLPIALAWGFSPSRSAEAARLILAAGGPGALPALELSVEPGAASVARGQPVTIRAQVHGSRRPSGAWLEMRRPEGTWSRSPMDRQPEAPAAADSYLFAVRSLEGDLEYRVRAGWAESPVYRLRALEPLQALGYMLLYESPAYTGIPPRREAAARGDVAALEGTRVTIEVAHRRPGARGSLRFDDGTGSELLAEAADRLAGAWTVERAGRYCVELRDDAAAQIWRSDSFRVTAAADLRPAVRMLAPAPAIRMPPEMQVALEIEGLDDFGLTELALVYGRSEDQPSRVTLERWPASSAPRDIRRRHLWNLAELQVLPGQELYYYLQVLDNDPLHGPKAGETPLFTIRFPTLPEMYAHAEEERRDEIRALAETLERQTDLQEELGQMARELRRDERVSWERQQQVEALLERQESLAGKVEEIQQSLAASQQRMENQNLFSPEILGKVREVQELVAEIQSGEFHQALERLRRAMESLDPQELQRAMEQLQASQEDVAQALDRTLQMLKRLLADEQIDRLKEQAAALEARQAEVNRQLEQGGAADSTRALSPEERAELSAQQEALERQLEELRSQLQELADKSGEMPDIKQALEQLLAQPDSREAAEQMRQALQAMEQADRSGALKFGRKARQGLQQMQQAMQQMTMQIDMEQLEAIARSLYAIANRLVGASQREEELLSQSGLGPRDLARRQQELYEEAREIGDSLVAVSRLTPYVGRAQLRALGEALERIQRSRDAFGQGQRRLGEAMAGEAMRGLNSTTIALLEAASQCSQSACNASVPSPFHRLQTLSGQQQCLNQDTQQMIGACQTPRLAPGQQESLARLAARQEMIRQGLEEIRGDLQESGRMMGDAGRMIEEMEEVVRQLKAQRADPQIVQRQERILSRLLNAQRSLRRQDETEERRSRTGEDPGPRTSPLPVEAGRSPAEVLQRAMLRGSQDPVPGEYRRLVDAYLRALLRAR
ncbi:MAG: hypothetical protein FJY75_00545 [Candidatus Eisenbacteria bacterium]|uniref:DUF4175 family protein n=1 Tax=Eiseniibacteriota bacterium TaxID=2212470 RepID=A0A937X9F2_UNCEI|nr:hypothetical protein [Candidatus Eisenbacteria bacterium]